MKKQSKCRAIQKTSNVDLIKFSSSNQEILDGMLFRSDSSLDTTLIHVHGSFGNFYQNPLVGKIGTLIRNEGINFFSFNLTCHDGIAEGYKTDGSFNYVGGAVSDFDSCVADIQGAVDLVSEFSSKIVLQGHSMGCDRVIHFLKESQAQYDCVLLSPCDSRHLHKRWLINNNINDQIHRIKEQLPEEETILLSDNEYGLREEGGWTYPIPVSRKAFLSIAEGPPFNLLSLENRPKYFLNVRSLALLGSLDNLRTFAVRDMENYLNEKFQHLEVLEIEGTDHNFSGKEKMIAKIIIKFVKENHN